MSNENRVLIYTVGTTSPATGAAPTLATDGLSLKGLASVAVEIKAATAVTLSGAGSALVWFYQPAATVTGSPIWVRIPGADQTITLSGVQGLQLVPLMVDVPRDAGRFFIQLSGVTFSAGSAGLTVSLVGQPTNELVSQGRLSGI